MCRPSIIASAIACELFSPAVAAWSRNLADELERIVENDTTAAVPVGEGASNESIARYVEQLVSIESSATYLAAQAEQWRDVLPQSCLQSTWGRRPATPHGSSGDLAENDEDAADDDDADYVEDTVFAPSIDKLQLLASRVIRCLVDTANRLITNKHFPALVCLWRECRKSLLSEDFVRFSEAVKDAVNPLKRDVDGIDGTSLLERMSR